MVLLVPGDFSVLRNVVSMFVYSHCVHVGEMSWLCGGFWRFWCGTLLYVLVAVFLCIEVRRALRSKCFVLSSKRYL
jgi:hypothetical protein